MALSMMSRPQISIDRLPPRRSANEPRELMNCKSCRKRKIKCNRLKPSCEACQVFAVPCIYDAVPKKRGPKTDVLEALLKRVDGLEKRLKPEDKRAAESLAKERSANLMKKAAPVEAKPAPPNVDIALAAMVPPPPPMQSTVSPAETLSQVEDRQTDGLLETYFAKLHGKPFYLLDEPVVRQRIQTGQLPGYLLMAIYAISSRFCGDQGIPISKEYALKSRQELDIDEPSIDGLQCLVLLSQYSYQAGQGRKAYMYLSSAISMAFAMNLHREISAIPEAIRESRRRIFWTCYMLDRFLACGSKRPCLISDECISLRLPIASQTAEMVSEGMYFSGASNLQYMLGGMQSLGASGILIEIVRILGMTNRYLATDGPKKDSHFPWHSLSNLSKIRQELEVWASDTQETFSSLDILFGHPDSTILILSKLIYHLIHCLIYRPFIPVDLYELSATTQHQSWRIEATNLCFFHANAITELIEFWKTRAKAEWPAFVAYCICTAGTVHVHGCYYRSGNGEIFSASKELLAVEVGQLTEMGRLWDGVQNQLGILQSIYVVHSELVTSLAGGAARPSAVFNYEDFFDRYQGKVPDGAFLELSDQLKTAAMPQYQQATNSRILTGSAPYGQQQFINTVGTSPMDSLPKRRITVSEQSHGAGSRHNASRKRSMTAPSPADGYPGGQQAEQMNNYSFAPPVLHPGAEGMNGYDPMLSMSAQLDDATSPRIGMRTMPNQGRRFGPEGDGLKAGEIASSSLLGSVVPEAEAEHDPFLSLLEQLAENEQSRGGPSELDFFLSNG